MAVYIAREDICVYRNLDNTEDGMYHGQLSFIADILYYWDINSKSWKTVSNSEIVSASRTELNKILDDIKNDILND